MGYKECPIVYCSGIQIHLDQELLPFVKGDREGFIIICRCRFLYEAMMQTPFILS